MSKHGWLTPNEIPEATTCRSLLIPDDVDIVAAVSGALLPLTKQYNWEQFGTVTPEEIAEAMMTMYVAWLSDACAAGGEVPAPFWDDPDGADSDDELPPEEQPWYEELSHWIIAGFLAITFTPAAGIFYMTTIRPARIAFRARDYGAVAEILVDGVLQGEVDTFSGVDQVIYYDFDIPVPGGFSASAFDPVEVIVRHSGEHNPDATPTDDGYAIEVIRDYFGRASDGQPVSRVGDDGILEVSLDGGETWVDAPQSDPRNQNLFPPLTGGNEQCRAAASAVEMIDATLDELLTGMANGGSAFSGAWLLVSLLAGRFGGVFAGLFFGAPVVAIATFLISFIIDAGIATISSAMTPAVYDKLRCILSVLMDTSGRMPEANMPRLYAALYAEIGGIPAQVLDLLFDFIGAGGLSNFAAQDADPTTPCVCCPPSVVTFSEPFTGGAGWRTQIGIWKAGAPQGGVYDETVGRTALGSVRATNPTGSQLYADALIDLGQACRVRNAAFYTRSSDSPGGTPTGWQIAWFNAAGVLLGSSGSLVSTSTTWALRSNVMDVTGVRFMNFRFYGNPGRNLYIDDISFLWSVS